MRSNSSRGRGSGKMNKLVPLALMVLPVIGCADSTGPDLNLTIFSGDQQVGMQYAVLAEALMVEVVDAAGQPVVGAQLEFLPGQGSGQALDAVSTTDESGRAQFRWELGA